MRNRGIYCSKAIQETGSGHLAAIRLRFLRKNQFPWGKGQNAVFDTLTCRSERNKLNVYNQIYLG